MAKDKLTNLLYFDDFKEEVGRIIADQSRKYVVMSGNISNFKYINNIYGYEKGDRLLKAIADVFFLSADDCLVGCRLHSDPKWS